MTNNEIIDNVLKFLLNKREVMITSYMSSNLGLNPNKIYQILDAMEEDGLIKLRNNYQIGNLTLKGENLANNLSNSN